jgi:hypothetical protein
LNLHPDVYDIARFTVHGNTSRQRARGTVAQIWSVFTNPDYYFDNIYSKFNNNNSTMERKPWHPLLQAIA